MFCNTCEFKNIPMKLIYREDQMTECPAFLRTVHVKQCKFLLSLDASSRNSIPNAHVIFFQSSVTQTSQKQKKRKGKGIPTIFSLVFVFEYLPGGVTLDGRGRGARYLHQLLLYLQHTRYFETSASFLVNYTRAHDFQTKRGIFNNFKQ